MMCENHKRESHGGSPLSDKSCIADVIIPVYKPDGKLIRLLEMLGLQTVRARRIRLINTEPEAWQQFLTQQGLTQEQFSGRFPETELTHIRKEEFDHGRTRNLGVRAAEGADYVIMMTQDAVPADTLLIEALLKPLSGDPSLFASYARQAAGEDAKEAERYTRTFNYPETPRVKSERDAEELGIKTYFCSNVCAAYKRDVLLELGLFPENMIFNEDMVLTGRALQAGWSVRYSPEAVVLHSHNYTAGQQFHRNFDLGISQADHPEIFGRFPSEGEGVRYAKAVISYLMEKKAYAEILPFAAGCAARYAGFRLGRSYTKLPKKLALKCTSNRTFLERRLNSSDEE